MKQFLFIFATILLDVAACVGGGGHHGSDEVAVSTTMVSLSPLGESQDIFITSNTKWTVSGASSWLFVSPMEGSNNGKITITANKNTENLPRACTLYVQASNYSSATIQVTQANQPLSQSIYGVYTGRLMCGTELIQDNYIVTINKLTGTMVEVIAGFFGDAPINFNLSEDGNQIFFSNILVPECSMYYIDGTLNIMYLYREDILLSYTGTRQ